jgi:YVTN family beta-propeller protein
MAVADGALWVADCKEGALKRIDTRTAQITATIPTGIANPFGELNVVAGAGSIWVASDGKGVVSRIDPATNSVIATIPVDPGTFYRLRAGIAVGGQQRAAVRPAHRSRDQCRCREDRAGQGTRLLAAGEGAVWVQEQGDGTVARIDPPRAPSPVASRWAITSSTAISTLAAARWLRTTADQVFVVIDPATLAIRAHGQGFGQRRAALHAQGRVDDLARRAHALVVDQAGQDRELAA